MKSTLIIIGAIALIAVIALWHAGMFAKVEISQQDSGSFMVVYQEHQGAYSKVGPTMDEVYQKLLDDGIDTTRGIGIYYDDPREVEEAELRSEVGSIIEIDDQAKLEQVKDKYQIKLIDRYPSLVIELPYRSKLSIIIGVLKAYPAFVKYCQEHECQTGAMFEIYDQVNKKIQYIYPLESNLEFGKAMVEEKPTYQIEKVLDQACANDDDCLVPADYAIRSNCPYEARCLDNKCTVVCPDPEPLIGGQRDEHGCLGPAGYSWSEEISACIRSWEIKEDADIQAAKLAVVEVGATEGLTIISVAKVEDNEDCQNCFAVKLDKAGQRYLITIEDGQAGEIKEIE